MPRGIQHFVLDEDVQNSRKKYKEMAKFLLQLSLSNT